MLKHDDEIQQGATRKTTNTKKGQKNFEGKLRFDSRLLMSYTIVKV